MQKFKRETLEGLQANLQKAIRDYIPVNIAGGIFEGERLQILLDLVDDKLKAMPATAIDIDAAIQHQNKEQERQQRLQQQKGMPVRRVMYKGKKYKLTFDEYNILDTTESEKGNLLLSTNPACRYFIAHQHDILAKRSIKNLDYI